MCARTVSTPTMKTGCIRLLYVGVFGLFVGGVFVLVFYFFELDVGSLVFIWRV